MQIRRVVAATAAVTIAATSLVACSSDSDDSDISLLALPSRFLELRLVVDFPPAAGVDIDLDFFFFGLTSASSSSLSV